MLLSRELTLACELTGDVEAIKKAERLSSRSSKIPFAKVTYNILISLHN